MTQLIIGSMKLKAVGLWTDQSRVSSGTLSPTVGVSPLVVKLGYTVGLRPVFPA